jgi:hypothetical protein
MRIRVLIGTLAVALILSAGAARSNALNQSDIDAFRGLIAKNLDLKKDILTAGRGMAGDDARQCMLDLATGAGGVADRLVLLITHGSFWRDGGRDLLKLSIITIGGLADHICSM